MYSEENNRKRASQKTWAERPEQIRENKHLNPMQISYCYSQVRP